MKGDTHPAGERLIKRYDNRKLYDPAARRYVTIQDLGRMVASGEDVRVVDQATGDDLTAAVLAQVILEGIKERSVTIPRQVLARLIRLAGAPLAEQKEWLSAQDAASRARQEAERIVGGLMARGRLSLEEALALRQEITGTVHTIVTDAQQSLEARVRSLLEPTEGVGPSLSGLKERLLSLESWLGPAPAPRKGTEERPRAGKTPARGQQRRK